MEDIYLCLMRNHVIATRIFKSAERLASVKNMKIVTQPVILIGPTNGLVFCRFTDSEQFGF